MHEAVFENRLGDSRDAARAGHQRHELRLEIGREAGEGGGRDIDRLDRAAGVAADAQTLFADVDDGAGLFDGFERGFQMLGLGALAA